MPKKEFKTYNTSPLIKQGHMAMHQCLAPMMDSSVKLRMNTVNKFNDKGRPEHVQKLVDFPCVIYPDGTTTVTNKAGGSFSTTRYHVMFMPPQRLNMSDILECEAFGILKIIEFDGYNEFGLTSAKAIKLGAGWDIQDGDQVRVQPVDLF